MASLMMKKINLKNLISENVLNEDSTTTLSDLENSKKTIVDILDSIELLWKKERNRKVKNQLFDLVNSLAQADNTIDDIKDIIKKKDVYYENNKRK